MTGENSNESTNAIEHSQSSLLDQKMILQTANKAARGALYHAELLRCAKGAYQRKSSSQEEKNALSKDACFHLGRLKNIINSVNIHSIENNSLKSKSLWFQRAQAMMRPQKPVSKFASVIQENFMDGLGFVAGQNITVMSEWLAIGRIIDATTKIDNLNDWKVDEIYNCIHSFLKKSRTIRRRLTDAFQTYVRKHLLVMLGITGFSLLVFLVEPIGALFAQRKAFSTACVFCQIILPWLVIKMIILKLHLKTPFWKGDDPTRSNGYNLMRISVFFAHPAMAYPQGTEAFARGSILLRKVIKGVTLTVLMYLALFVLLSFIMSLHVGLETVGGARTVVLVCAIMGALMAGLHLLDFFDWLEDLPIRICGVFLAVGFTLICMVTDCSFFTLGIIVILLGLTPTFASFFLDIIRIPFAILFGFVAVVIGASLIIADYRADEFAWSDSVDSPGRQLISALEWPHQPPGPSKSAPPVVVIAASGGGSRAAYFTAKVLSQLDQLCPDNSTDCSKPIGKHVQAISSVSGGTLASSAYVAARYHKRPTDQLPKVVNDDFLRPAIIGAINPFQSRSQMLLDYWRKKLTLTADSNKRSEFKPPPEPTMGDLAKQWKFNEGETPLFPLPLINSTTLDSHAVVISPLEYTAYNDRQYGKARNWAMHHKLDSDEETWVRFRSGIYGLENLLKNYDPDLAMATLASANFPFGFPLVRLVTSEPLVYSPLPDDRTLPEQGYEKKTVCLTDGGVLSNSGMWSLYHLLANTAKSNDSLKRRGVILIVVDISKMPIYHGKTGSYDLFQALGDQAPLGTNIHRAMFELLHEKLDGRLEVIQMVLEPHERFNVYTSWALDNRSLKSLDAQFDVQWQPNKNEGAKDKILKAWNKLKNDKTYTFEKPQSPRVPVD